MSISQNNMLIATLDMDWISSDGYSWEIASENELGQELFYYRYQNSELQNRLNLPNKRLQSQLRQISVGAKQFLSFDGHFIPLMANELPCLLNHKLPLAWKYSVSSLYLKDSVVYMIKDSEDRKIVLSQNRAGHMAMKIIWGGFLGIGKKQILATITKTAKEEETEIIVGELKANWVRIHDQE